MGCQYRVSLTLYIGVMARPFALCQVNDDIRPNRIEPDVSIATQYEIFFTSQAGTKPTFPKRSAAAQVHLMYCTQEVVNTTTLLGVLLNPFKVKLVIFISEKTGLAIVTALNHMQRNSRQNEPRLSWHVADLLNCSLL
jgi:hypothetical protein